MEEKLMIAGIVFVIALIGFILNIVNVFRTKPLYEDLVFAAVCIFNLAGIEVVSLMKEYDVPAIFYYPADSPAEYHTPISIKYSSGVIIVVIIYLASMFMFLKMKNRVPPLIKSAGLSGMLCGVILNIVIAIQLFKNINQSRDIPIFLFYLPITANILFSINMIKKIVMLEKSKEKDIENSSRFIKFIYKSTEGRFNIYLIVFALFLPLIILTLILAVLFGEKPDVLIKAFTETSDWTLSQKISPPPVSYQGHYLCTAAANGHEKIVKPTRVGIRDNSKIVVNRQLCIANAFEQLIEERVPKIHRIIRKNYDRYGYPLSKHINTKFQADIIYILMKPMEWFFLICLYTFDIKPENRIALQYTGKKQEEIIN